MPSVRRSSQACRLALTLLAVAGPPAWAGRHCDAPPETWQPRSAVAALAVRNGWRVDRLKVDDGCYEIKGHDAEGRLLKATLDPATLKVIRIKRGHGDGDGEGGRDRDRSHDRPGEGPRPASPPSAPALPIRTPLQGAPG